MSKKWSQKTEKATLAADDEFLIIDSEDANAATKNKRVKVKNAVPYNKYVALLTQTGTNAPVAIVLENTIGNIVWTRTGAGIYEATLAGAFTLNKTVGFMGAGNMQVGYYLKLAFNTSGNNNSISIRTGNEGSGTGINADTILLNTPIEIRVYSVALP